MCYLILLLSLWIHQILSVDFVIDTVNNGTNKNIYVPTKEWKEILPGQVIPPGLHVRHNLQTGKSEAKLMDNESSDELTSTSLVQVSNDSVDNLSEINKKFRSYAEIKEEFNKLKLNMKTDYELLKEFMSELSGSALDTERILIIMEDISNLLHQIDNGYDFAVANGFKVLLPYLNHFNVSVRRASMKVVGSSLQENPKVKNIALKQGILDVIHSSIKASSRISDLNERSNLISTCLISLGAFLRHFPVAQRHFFTSLVGYEPPGFELLSQVIASNSKPFNKHRIRILTLLSDIYSERKEFKANSETNPTEKNLNAWQLYANIPFEEGFVMSGMCDSVSDSLMLDTGHGENNDSSSNNSNSSSTTVNHDQREKIILFANNFIDICRDSLIADQFRESQILNVLSSLEQEYLLIINAERNPEQSYFNSIYQEIQSLKSHFLPQAYTRVEL